MFVLLVEREETIGKQKQEFWKGVFQLLWCDLLAMLVGIITCNIGVLILFVSVYVWHWLKCSLVVHEVETNHHDSIHSIGDSIHSIGGAFSTVFSAATFKGNKLNKDRVWKRPKSKATLHLEMVQVNIPTHDDPEPACLNPMNAAVSGEGSGEKLLKIRCYAFACKKCK